MKIVRKGFFCVVLAVLFAGVFTSNTHAKPITSVTPNNLEKHIQRFSQKKPLVVYFSSTDTKCGFCVKGNALLEKAQKSLGNDYNFVQVNFNPWKSMVRYKALRAHFADLGFPINGLPTAVIYYKSKARLYDTGAKDTLVDDLRQAIKLSQTTPGVTSDKPMSGKSSGFQPSAKISSTK